MLLELCHLYVRENLTIPYKAVFNRVKFKQTWSKGFMHFNGCTYDFTALLISIINPIS